MKGQSQLIGVVLLTLVIITTIGITYMWGMPLIEKQKDAVRVSNGERFIKELDKKIQNVAKNGGTQTINNPVIPGVLSFIEVSDIIELTFQTTGTDIATEKDIYLRGDENDEVVVGNEVGIIKVLSGDIGRSLYNVTMDLHYRNLTGSNSVYIIDLINIGKNKLSGNGNKIVISEGGVSHITQSDGKDVYTTKINVRFE